MRTAEFDKTFVLRQAMQTFMQFGYSKTSMQKLTEATGLHPGSIYCAFQNKKGLLLAAVEQYQADKRTQMAELFAQYDNINDALHAFISKTILQCGEDESAQVCLLTKTLTEIEGQDDEVCRVLSGNLNQFELALQTQLQSAIDNQQLSTNPDAKTRAQFLVMGIYGLRTLMHTNPCSTAMRSIADELIQHVLR
ncbi:TetR/AcrR family transcriptional regulator [Pseudoalteromonas fenneropenaei]|uniref:TetR/AcrR family transcriptional regulator n=1 Tax=Pseudoalteromonas fenneropenaei TaxID=1737459 RepID=A0ABV7CPS8_9GAMM